MRATPVNDMFATSGYLREDGRMVHDMYLTQIKTPAESTDPWDVVKILKDGPWRRCVPAPGTERMPPGQTKGMTGMADPGGRKAAWFGGVRRRDRRAAQIDAAAVTGIHARLNGGRASGQYRAQL